VPAKVAARVRLFDTGHNRKTDAHGAHAVAAVAVRTHTLRVLQLDGELEALRMLTDRREALTRRRVQTVDRLQALLAELLPGRAKRDITHGSGQGDAGVRAIARHRREDPSLLPGPWPTSVT
jgi:transposase